MASFEHAADEIVRLQRSVNDLTAALAAAHEELNHERTERRRIEDDLRESRLILDSIPGLVALLTATGDVDVVNRQVIEYFGQTLEELRQWGTNDTIHPEDLPHVIDVFSRSIASGSPYEISQRFRRSDGVYRWFQNSGFPLRDANGHIVRWCVLLTDIDERKRAEDALRASERNLKLIIDTIPALAWSARPDGSAEFFNQHYLDFMGLSAEQAGDWGWTAAVHPDDLERPGSHVAAHHGLCEHQERPKRDCAATTASIGGFSFARVRCATRTGSIVKWYGVNTDIEDRKRAEAELRRAYDSFAEAQRLSKTGSFITDLVGDDHNWSDEAYRIFEFDPGTTDHRAADSRRHSPGRPAVVRVCDRARLDGASTSISRSGS